MIITKFLLICGGTRAACNAFRSRHPPSHRYGEAGGCLYSIWK
jgi:hypothetical protein